MRKTGAIPNGDYAEGVLVCLTILYGHEGIAGGPLYRDIAESAMKYEHLIRFAKARNWLQSTGLDEYDKSRCGTPPMRVPK